MSGEEGVMATGQVLVQQGTLQSRRDILPLRGANYGRVRAMYSDLGQPDRRSLAEHARAHHRSLEACSNADDLFYVVDELTTAKEIAGGFREKKDREAALNKFKPVDLGSLSAAKTKAKITELKVILKVRARGSVEAIREGTGKARLYARRGYDACCTPASGPSPSPDVELALDQSRTMARSFVGFNVHRGRRGAETGRGTRDSCALREYQIIYNLVDDVKAALEGRLKPIEEVVHLGRAVVRQTFKVGKVGTIAGCYVTSGVIERSARVRIIRGGMPVVFLRRRDSVVGLDSLKRFKDDAREVREGFECGLKITGYDDIKVDDVIEAFKIETRARTL